MKCDFCKKEVNYLYSVEDETDGTPYSICAACCEMEDNGPIGDPDIEISALTITMDSTMLTVLENQAETEGFQNVESFARNVLFQLAVAAKIEDLGELEEPDEEAAFIQEMKRWLAME